MALTKIKTSGIADNAITNAKMADDAIDSADFADASIDNVHVATGLDAVKLADGTVTNTELQYINTLSSNAQTQISAKLPLSGGAMTGAITTNSTFDGVDIATRDGILSSTTTTANAALPKAGGAMTGAITTNSTFDGVDIATRDGVLTSTTTTANAALPKAGGTMTGNIVMADDTSIGISDSDERIEFDGAGDISLLGANVGIGTTAPSALLHVHKADSNVEIARFESTGADGTYRDIKIGVPDYLGVILRSYRNSGGGDFAIITGGPSAYVSSLFCQEDGNVGIGTNAPLMPLSIAAVNGDPATSGTTPVGNLRLEDISTGNNIMDLGIYDSSPWGSWIQTTDRTNLGAVYPLSLNPNGGNVGIGEAAPESLLTLKGDDATVYNDTEASGQMTEGTSLAVHSNTNTTNTFANLVFKLGNTGTAYTRITGIRTGSNLSEMAFITENGSPAEAMRIDSSGNIMFGTSSDTAQYNDTSGEGSFSFLKGYAAENTYIALSSDSSVGYALVYLNAIDGADNERFISFIRSNTEIGTIALNGTTQVQYNTSGSDRRLKKNFADWDELVLPKFDALNPQLFHFKTQDDSEDKLRGYIAQDAVDNFPEAYPKHNPRVEANQTEEYYQFNPSGMVHYLMKAVKELSAKVTALENA
jgi:hypothetical protein